MDVDLGSTRYDRHLVLFEVTRSGRLSDAPEWSGGSCGEDEKNITDALLTGRIRVPEEVQACPATPTNRNSPRLIGDLT